MVRVRKEGRKEGRREGGKERRKEGKKERRKEGRKEIKKEGREEGRTPLLLNAFNLTLTLIDDTVKDGGCSFNHYALPL